MVIGMLPGPQPDGSEPDHEDPGQPHASERDARADQSNQRHTNPHVATEDECLAMLTRLPALVALRAISTAQANSIRAIYTSILQHHREQRSTDDRRGASSDGLVEVLANHPELAEFLMPMMSDEEVAAFMARATGRNDGAA